MAVKLKNLTVGKPGSYTVKFSPETHAEVLAYVEAYQEEHGTEIPVDVLIAGIVIEYISSDTEFLAWKKANAKGGAQSGGKGKPKPASAPPPASEPTSEAQ
jgi:hypothetical protein